MDLLSTLLACSLYIADDDLTRAIAESNSQSNPYFVLDTTLDATEMVPQPPPQTADAAVLRAEDILAHGGRPVLGLMQLPPGWIAAFGRPLRDAFDPCVSVAIGTAMLSQFDDECRGPTAAPHTRLPGRSAPHGAIERRACVLRKYQDAIGVGDFVTMTTLELRFQRHAEPDIARAPIFAMAPASPWGPQTLLVSTAPVSFLSTPASPPPSLAPTNP